MAARIREVAYVLRFGDAAVEEALLCMARYPILCIADVDTDYECTYDA